MTAEQLLGNKKLLDAILSFHVVPAVVTSSQIKSGQVRDCRSTIVAATQVLTTRQNTHMQSNSDAFS
jgi:uncharacterized surface protein with fasciclin (FAS1) repeats